MEGRNQGQVGCGMAQNRECNYFSDNHELTNNDRQMPEPQALYCVSQICLGTCAFILSPVSCSGIGQSPMLTSSVIMSWYQNEYLREVMSN